MDALNSEVWDLREIIALALILLVCPVLGVYISVNTLRARVYFSRQRSLLQHAHVNKEQFGVSNSKDRNLFFVCCHDSAEGRRRLVVDL